ncbi:MAG: helix-turn-helix domain-containing protein [Chitinispirillia bacterium]|nr:helix-turn-helix domain-containing protein [Chitinispirillia bacterium]
MNRKPVSPVGRSWDEVESEIFSPEEIAASDLRVALMIEIANARAKKGISQKKLEIMSGVRQPIIARMEKGSTSPQLDTVLKVLTSLGKTLYIGDLRPQKPRKRARKPGGSKVLQSA